MRTRHAVAAWVLLQCASLESALTGVHQTAWRVNHDDSDGPLTKNLMETLQTMDAATQQSELWSGISHGTKSFENPMLEETEYVTLPVVAYEAYALPCWKVTQTLPTITKQLRSTRRQRISKVLYDPASADVDFDGHCMYATAAYIYHGKEPTKKQMYQMRTWIRRWWLSHPDLLDQVAVQEDMDASQYLATYIRKGWGGLPEWHAFASATGLAVTVIGKDDEELLCLPGRDHGLLIRYMDSHYVVVDGEQIASRRGLAMAQRPLRGGMPALRLVDRHGKKVYEKRYRAPMRPVPELPIEPPDTRPPLERKRKQQKNEGDDLPAEDNTEKNLQQMEEVPDVATALRHARPKARPRLEKQEKSTNDPGRDRMAVHWKDYSTTPPTGERTPAELVAALALAESKRLQSMIDGKYPVSRRVSDDPPTVPASTMTAMGSTDKPMDDPPMDMESVAQKPYVSPQVEGHFCMLCLKWIDRWHLRSKMHTMRCRWYDALPTDGKRRAEAEMEKSAELHWKALADQHSLRGGGRGQELMPSASKAASTTEADSLPAQRVSTKTEEVSFSSGGHVVGEATCGPYANVVPQESENVQDSRSSEELPLEVENWSDGELEMNLGRTIRQDFRVSVRGPRAWLPISLHPSTPMSEIYAMVAIVFVLPVHGFSLFSQEGTQLPSDLTARDWIQGNDSELTLVRRPHSPRPSLPRGPLPVLDPVVLREEDYVSDPQNLLDIDRETACMAKEDARVISFQIRNSRQERQQSAYQGITIDQLSTMYARIKKVGKERVHPYVPADPHHILQHGQQVLLLTAQPARGGATIFVKNRDAWMEITIHDSTTAWELKVEHDWMSAFLLYKGAEVHDSVMLEQLRDDLFEISYTCPATWLRARNHCKRVHILSLTELLEWFDSLCPEGEPTLELRIAAAMTTWRSHSAWSQMAERQLLRGAGRQGKLPWESSSSVSGMKLASEIAVEDQVVPQIHAHQVCEQTTGVALTLLSTWSSLKSIEAAKPLLLVFPGHCGGILRKLGASPGRVEEMEVILEEPGTHSLLKRKATTLALSDHKFTFGHGLKSVSRTPTSSSEFLVEMDDLWAPTVNVQAALRDWRTLAKDLLSKLCMETIAQEHLYGFRETSGPPRIWTLKAKLPPEIGEKLLCASGQQGVFVRPLVPQKDSSAQQYTIVWGPRHQEAGDQTLATMLSHASRFAANRGLARSLIGIGLRIRWTDVQQARRLLRPDDPSLLPSTMSLQDQRHFRMQGVPSTASTSELAKFCVEVGWLAIPQSRLTVKGEASWILSAADPPAQNCYKWGQVLVLIQEIEEDDLRQARIAQHKKRAKAIGSSAPSAPLQKEGSTAAGHPQAGKSSVDPLQEVDPWSGFKNKSLSTSARQMPSRAYEGPSPAMQHAPCKVVDDRVDAVLVRLDNLEAKQTGTDSRLDKLDGNVEALGVSMSSQFTTVLRSIQELAEMQKSKGEQESRRKPALAPFSGQSAGPSH